MQLQDYLDQLRVELLRNDDVIDVQCSYAEADEVARVHAHCTHGRGVTAVTAFVTRKDVSNYRFLDDGEHLPRILKALKPTLEEQAASEAAYRELDVILAKQRNHPLL